MPRARAEPFLFAVAELRSRLARGRYPSETRFAAAELATEFGLSATPVREALARLTGEGLLEERRGQGVFLPRVTAADIADLYRLSEAHLRLALTNGPAPVPAPASLAADAAGSEAVEASEHLFHCWAARAGGRILAQSYARIARQLGRVRRLEPELLEDLAGELNALVSDALARPAQAASRVRAFHDRRIRLAARLAERLEQADQASQTLSAI